MSFYNKWNETRKLAMLMLQFTLKIIMRQKEIGSVMNDSFLLLFHLPLDFPI